MLEHRSENLEVRSPIDGIVIGGDLKRAEGVPVQVGQTLFEVAPLASMDVEIEIPGGEIALLKGGLPVQVVLDAFPGKSGPAGWNVFIRGPSPGARHTCSSGK